MVFVEHFELSLESLGCYKCPLMICGDLNINTLETNMLTGNYLEIFEGNGCMITSKDVTRVTNQSSTCIDHMIIRNFENYEFSVMQESFPDHYPLSLSCRQKSVAKSKRVKYRNTAFLKNSMKIERLNFVLLDSLIPLGFSLSSISIMPLFMQILNETLDKIAPLQESRKYEMAKPAWFTKGLKKFIGKRNLAHKEWLRTGKYESLCNFEELLKRVHSGIRLNKSEYFVKQFEKCVGGTNKHMGSSNWKKEFGKHQHSER